MFRYITHKSARFGVAVPYGFLAKQRKNFKFSAPFSAEPKMALVLSEEKVSYCRDILSLARTYFQKNS